MEPDFPYVAQKKFYDCGITCLVMIIKYYLKQVPNNISFYLENAFSDKVSFFDLCEIANSVGFNAIGFEVSYEELNRIVPLPCIVYWKNTHFLVVHKIENDDVHIADPASGLFSIKKHDFCEGWLSYTKTGMLLAIEPKNKSSLK